MPKANQTAKQQQSKVNEAVARLVRLSRAYLRKAREAHRAYLYASALSRENEARKRWNECMEARKAAWCFLRSARIVRNPDVTGCTIVPVFHH